MCSTTQNELQTSVIGAEEGTTAIGERHGLVDADFDEILSEPAVEGVEEANHANDMEFQAELEVEECNLDDDRSPDFSDDAIDDDKTESKTPEVSSESEVAYDHGTADEQIAEGPASEEGVETKSTEAASALEQEISEIDVDQSAHDVATEDVMGTGDIGGDVEVASALPKTHMTEALHQAELPETSIQDAEKSLAKAEGIVDAETDANPAKANADLASKRERVSDSESTEEAEDADNINDAQCSDQDSIPEPHQTGGQVTTQYFDMTEGQGEAKEVRVFPVQAASPQDLHFKVPEGSAPGQILTVQGPHGPLRVQVPPGGKPGTQIAVRLAAHCLHEVFVPAGAKPGQKVTFMGENDEEVEAVVPPGKKPGQVFHVSPPVVMLPVPLGAVPGDLLTFTVPVAGGSFKSQAVAVPDNVVPGQYFSVRY